MKTTLSLAAALVLSAAPLLAGDQYIDETGFAVSGFDVVAYRSLDQAPVGAAQPEAVPGLASITAEYNGATFAFATEENKAAFQENPDFYVPQYDGHCAYGVAKGGKVPANPHLWRIVDDKLYLNITQNVVGFWEEDIAGNIDLATSNWSGIEGDAAATRTIPDFMSSAPTAN